MASSYSPLKTLSDQQLAVLATASPLSVENALKDLRARLNGQWLRRNRYAKDVVGKIHKESLQRMDGRKLADYAAVSVPLHLTDGWVYLARAANAIVNGDWAGGVHLGYYAELRAAMALLASQGVIVLDGKHVCLDASMRPRVIQDRQFRTHPFTWAAIEAWRTWTGAGTSIYQSLQVEGITLAEWLDAAGMTPRASKELERRWLQDWSIDLRVLAGDQHHRNDVSYRPVGLNSVEARGFSNSISPLLEAWEIWEPSQGGRIPVFDRHLLRIALESAFRSKYSRAPIGAKFEDFIESVCETLDNSNIKEFLLRREQPNDPVVFRFARQTSLPYGALPVLSRAMILLRLSCARAALLLRNAGLDRNAIDFWANQFGADVGLWEPGAEPEFTTDLWADVELSNEAIRDSSLAKTAASLSAAWGEMPGEMHSIGKFERVAFWALGI